MSCEPRANIVAVHPDTYVPGRFKHPAKWFLGKLAKAKFRGIEGRAEYMWIRVTSTRRGEITGWLDNDPIIATYMRHGDEVTLRPKDVLAVQD